MHPKLGGSLLLPLFASAAFASSSTQCRGSCRVKQNTLVNQAPHSVHIDGPSHLVSDISQASGWEVLDCPRDWSRGAVDVRLFCTTDDPDANCHHVTEEGAENTVVRLPEECGTGPFARVARWEHASDQRIPSDAAAAHNLRRRGLTPSVVSARLDYNFRAIPEDRGAVTFDIIAAHHPEIRDAITEAHHVPRALREAATSTSTAYKAGPTPTGTRTRHSSVPAHTTTDAPQATDDFLGIHFSSILGGISTALGHISSQVGSEISTGIGAISTGISEVSTKVSNGVTSAEHEISTHVSEVSTKVAHGVTSAEHEVSTGIHDISTGVEHASTAIGHEASGIWNDVSTGVAKIDTAFSTLALPALADLANGVSKSGGFNAIDLQKSNVSFINEEMSCYSNQWAFDQSATITADVDIVLNAGYAFKIAGTISPPGLTDFALAGALSGNFDVTFDIDMYLSVDFNMPPVELFNVGVPGLDIPGLITLGPEVAVKAMIDLAVDVSFSATIPLTYDFNRVDFVFPSSLAPTNADAQSSKKTSTIEYNVMPGDQTGSFGLHILPRLEFGLDVLDGWAGADVYVGADLDATVNSNGTIETDFSYEGCQDLSIGAIIEAGVTASALKFFNTGDSITLFQIRDTLWTHCSASEDGPTTAIYDNGDGVTYTSALGDLVNQFGQLIDDAGNIIDDFDAADLDPTPINGENGTAIPEEDLILDNLDSTFEDAWGNLTTNLGQRIGWNGTLLGCELDTTNMTDANGTALDASDAIFEADDGSFSNYLCQLVNEEGSLVDEDGNEIDYEDFIDAATNTTIDFADAVIDNEDGTFSDPWGNPVDMWGGAIDIDVDGNVYNVTLTPDDGSETSTQEPADPEETANPNFTLMAPAALETIAINLLKGIAPSDSGSVTVVSSSTSGSSSASTSGSSSASTSGSSSASTSSESSSTVVGTTSASSSDSGSSTTTASSSTSIESSSAESTSVASSSVDSTSVASSSVGSTSVESSSIEATTTPAPTATAATCAAKRKRDAAPIHSRSLAAPHKAKRLVSDNHRRKRNLLGKRSGFGCSLPSIGGLPVSPVSDFENLARLF